MALPDAPGNQVAILRAKIDYSYRLSRSRGYGFYLGFKLLALKLFGDFEVGRNFDVVAGGYTMAFSLFIHLFVGWVKYITARRGVLR